MMHNKHKKGEEKMSKVIKNRRKTTILLLALLTAIMLAVTVFAVGASGASAEGWVFSQDYVANPVYMKNHITQMPKTYEAYVNLTAKGTSPIISSYPGIDNRDSIKFGINYEGYPTLELRQNVWIPENHTYITLETEATFKDDASNVLGKGWVHIAITYEPGEDSNSFSLYLNGEHKQTITAGPNAADVDTIVAALGEVPALDVESMQECTREFSFGAEGSETKGSYFRGEINSAAMYSEVLNSADIADSCANGVNTGRSDLIAYYDYDGEGNGSDFIKDLSGNGHDFSAAFFERKEAIDDYAYSFAFLGDTQFVVEQDVLLGTTKYASPIYDWLVANKDSKNIKHVFGLGDITNLDMRSEWLYAIDLHEKLENADIPYAIIEGNHDDYKNHISFNRYFGDVEYFTDNIDGVCKEGKIENYYMNFDVGTHKYMLLALEFGARDDVLAWANRVVSENKDRRVIVITHSLVNSDGSWTEAGKIGESTTSIAELNNGIDMWNEFISLHENIIISAAGHIDTQHIKHRTDVGVNGNTVNSFLINPQGLDEGVAFESGMIAMFYFSEDGSEVQVEYISAYKTLEAQRENPSADDVLFCERNQFSFETAATVPLSIYTEYGALPGADVENKTFALFSDGEFIAGYESFAAIGEYLSGASGNNYQILLLNDYDNTGDTAVLPMSIAGITLDLGNYTLTASDKLLGLSGASGNLSLTVKNGSISVKNALLGTEEASAGNADVTFEDVTLDFKSLSGSVTLFDIDDANVAVNVNVLGGNIISDVATLSSVEFYVTDENDSVLFGSYNGANTKLITHTTAFDYAHYSESFPSDSGSLYFIEISDNGSESVYELQSLNVVGEDVTAVLDTDTYGTKILSAVDYPFVIADKSGTVVGIHDYIFNNNKDNTSAFGIAKVQVNAGNLTDGTAYILMRSDYTMRLDINGTAEKYQSTYTKGTIVLDMCGHSIISDETRNTWIFDITMRNATYTTTLTVKNGSIFTYGKQAYIAYFKTYNSSGFSQKTFNMTFDSVRFGLLEGSQIPRLFHVGNAQDTAADKTKVATINLTLTDCTFDMKTVEPTVSFNVLSTNFGGGNAFMSSNVRVNGGSIEANSLDKLTLTNFVYNDTNNLNFGIGADSKYIELLLPRTADASKFLIEKVKVKAEDGTEIGFVLYTKEGKSTYKLQFATKLGYAPAEYKDANKYPFIIFDNDGIFLNAAESFNHNAGATGAISIVRDYLKANVWDSSKKTYGDNALTATVLMMRDVEMSDKDYVSNLYALQGTVTVDLGGHELTASQYKPMFYSVTSRWDKSKDKYVFPTEIIIQNGTLNNRNQAVVKFKGDVKGKDFTYKFENVTFNVFGPSASPLVDYENQTIEVNSKIEFTGCTFNIKDSNATGEITLFGIGNSYFNTAVTVNGGTVIAGDKAFVVCNETAGNGSVTFKEYNGKYTTLSVSSSAAALAGTFNEGKLSFVKTSENESETVYILAPVKVKEYLPKMSITLDRNLILNVYIPTSGTQKFTLDGVKYENLTELSESIEEIDGNSYYRVSLPLDAKEAAKEIKFVATVDFDTKTSCGTFTFSIPEYAKSVIETSGANAAEVTLVKDVLAYVRAAYAYFGTDDAEAIESINSVIGESYSSAPVVEGSTNSEINGFANVTFVLDGTPAMRFYLPENADASEYAFFIGVDRVKTESDANGTYIDIDVYAYALCETVICKINGEEQGSFHINAYYEWTKGQNNDGLVNITASFWRYLQSARAYRDSVLGN